MKKEKPTIRRSLSDSSTEKLGNKGSPKLGMHPPTPSKLKLTITTNKAIDESFSDDTGEVKSGNQSKQEYEKKKRIIPTTTNSNPSSIR